MKVLAPILALIFIVSIACAQDIDRKLLDWAFPTRHQPGPEFQSSESVSIELGVRDKYGELGSFKATFIVTGLDGKKYVAQAPNEGSSEWTSVKFPEDFNPSYAPAGKYTWECFVNGKLTLRGRFEFATTFNSPPVRRRLR